MTLSGCLSRGARGRDFFVLCVIYVYGEDRYIILGFSLHERCVRGVEASGSLWGW